MRNIFFVVLNIFTWNVYAQKIDFSVQNISLPSEIAYYDNQFSGLYIYDDKLFLMSESRLQDKAEAKLYSIKIKDLQYKMHDTAFVLPYKKIPIVNLDILQKKMDAIGDEYEGLEAIVIKGSSVYLSVETTTPSDNCYIIKGVLNDSTIVLNDKDIILQPKPITPVGTHVYNAGYEALALSKNVLFSFFEFNYFPLANNVNMTELKSFGKVNERMFPIKKLPFRITDITSTGKNKFIGINYFYEGGGRDEVYRTPANETQNNSFIKDCSGYHSNCRLVSIIYKNGSFSWKPIWDLPGEYKSYNWEGIAAFQHGYFIINDKYTKSKPYSSVLLYLSPKK